MTVGDENSIKLQKAICLQKLYVVTFYYQGSCLTKNQNAQVKEANKN